MCVDKTLVRVEKNLYKGYLTPSWPEKWKVNRLTGFFTFHAIEVLSLAENCYQFFTRSQEILRKVLKNAQNVTCQ